MRPQPHGQALIPETVGRPSQNLEHERSQVAQPFFHLQPAPFPVDLGESLGHGNTDEAMERGMGLDGYAGELAAMWETMRMLQPGEFGRFAGQAGREISVCIDEVGISPRTDRETLLLVLPMAFATAMAQAHVQNAAALPASPEPLATFLREAAAACRRVSASDSGSAFPIALGNQAADAVLSLRSVDLQREGVDERAALATFQSDLRVTSSGSTGPDPSNDQQSSSASGARNRPDLGPLAWETADGKVVTPHPYSGVQAEHVHAERRRLGLEDGRGGSTPAVGASTSDRDDEDRAMEDPTDIDQASRELRDGYGRFEARLDEEGLRITAFDLFARVLNYESTYPILDPHDGAARNVADLLVMQLASDIESYCDNMRENDVPGDPDLIATACAALALGIADWVAHERRDTGTAEAITSLLIEASTNGASDECGFALLEAERARRAVTRIASLHGQTWQPDWWLSILRALGADTVARDLEQLCAANGERGWMARVASMFATQCVSETGEAWWFSHAGGAAFLMRRFVEEIRAFLPNVEGQADEPASESVA